MGVRRSGARADFLWRNYVSGAIDERGEGAAEGGREGGWMMR